MPSKGAYDQHFEIFKRMYTVKDMSSILSLGDGAVSYDHIQNGNPVWGCSIIGLMFLPNIVFVMWFLFGNKEKKSRRDAFAKVLVAGNVQLVTMIK